jgi:hypothetical protein
MDALRLILSLLLFLISTSTVASTLEKYALVIGNSDYDIGALNNPVNDATDIAIRLKSLGFNVSRLLNANLREMDQAIRIFTKQLTGKNKVGLFYFAGHGIELDGRNYLIPVNADIEIATDLKYSAVDAGRVLDGMEYAGNGLNMVILDACRNNPFKRRFRSVTNGLAKMEAPKGSLLIYATSPGDVADDGDARNGVFTRHFLESLAKPGLKPYEVFTETASGVIRETQDKQRPYIEGYITGTFYFLPGSSITIQELGTTSQDSSNKLDADIELWKSADSLATKEAYEAYLKRFPTGIYIDIAKLKLQSFSQNVDETIQSNLSTRISEDITQQEERKLSKDEITLIFSGKTVEGYNHKKKHRFQNYFDPIGALKGRNLKINKHFTGIWKVEENKLCREWKNQKNKCGKIQISNGIIQQFDPYGNLALTYESFTDGNKIKD